MILLKNLIKTGFIIIFIYTISGCSKNLNYSKSVDRNQKKFIDEGRSEEALFLVKVKSLNLLMKKISVYTENTGYARSVVDFAQTIKNDHFLLDTQLELLAASQGIYLPGSMSGDHWNIYNSLRNASKEEFDEQFLKEVKLTHERLISEFKHFAIHAKSDAIRSFASKKLEKVQEHMEQSEKIVSQLLETS